MKTIQFYKISALTLFILNIILMCFFFFTSQRPPHKRGHHFSKEAIKILQLNENQAITFEKLAKGHHQDMEAVQENQLEWTRKYFQEKSNTIKSDSLLFLIKRGEGKKIMITKNHFNDIKNILTSSQLPNYPEFEREALGRILSQKRPKPKR